MLRLKGREGFIVAIRTSYSQRIRAIHRSGVRLLKDAIAVGKEIQFPIFSRTRHFGAEIERQPGLSFRPRVVLHHHKQALDEGNRDVGVIADRFDPHLSDGRYRGGRREEETPIG